MSDDGYYVTPEGFALFKPLLMPDARSFSDVLTYVREWDYATMNARSGKVPHPELVPDSVRLTEAGMFGDNCNTIGPFCSIKSQRDGRRSIAVIVTQATIDALRGQLVTGDDRLSLEIIEHPANGRALVIAQHSSILGSRWLAYIDPTTIPEGGKT